MLKDLKNQLIAGSTLAIVLLSAAILLWIKGLVWPAVTAAVLVCALIAAVNVWFRHSVSKPLEELTGFSRRIADGSYGIQLENSRSDEIGHLICEINQMSEKAAVAEKSRTEFISQVSHELRTPLTAIMGWSETISYDPAVQGDSLRGINIISKEAERLTGMVRELLEFTRIQDGRFNMNMELIDITAELEDALFTYGELMKQAGMEINYSEPPSEIALIPGDPERLKQVFLNLLDNATKHGGDGRQIDVSIQEYGSFVRIDVRDYGHGIPDGELPHVKEKFYKGSSKNRGTGIGLSVCDEIITRHNGELNIQNADGGGCLVTVLLPRNSK